MRWPVAVCSIAIVGCGGARPDIAPLPDPAPPLQLAYAPPRVGESRDLVITSRSAIEMSVGSGAPHVQKSSREYRLRDIVVAIERGETLYQVVAVGSLETMEIAGDRKPDMATLDGTYLVIVDAVGGVQVARENRTPVEGIAKERLGDLYAGTIARPDPLLQVVAGAPLRTGETLALTPAQISTFTGGKAATGTSITRTVRSIDGNRATVEFVVVDRYQDPEAGVIDSGAKIELVVDVATARVARFVLTKRDAAASPTSTYRELLQTRVDYAYR